MRFNFDKDLAGCQCATTGQILVEIEARDELIAFRAIPGNPSINATMATCTAPGAATSTIKRVTVCTARYFPPQQRRNCPFAL